MQQPAPRAAIATAWRRQLEHERIERSLAAEISELIQARFNTNIAVANGFT